MKELRAPFAIVLVFVALASAVYFPVWIGEVPLPSDILYYFPAYSEFQKEGPLQQLPDNGDLITSFYQFRHFTSESVGDGVLPLWNPYFLAGAPFMPHSQTSLFYPPTFVFYILPLPDAWTISLMLRMVLAGSLMALLVRSMGGTHAAAIASGILYSLCGVLTAWQGYARSDTAVWLPLMFYAVVRLHTNPGVQAIAIAGVAFAMPIFAGHPETALQMTATTVAFAATLWVLPQESRMRPFDLKFASVFIAGSLLAIGVAAIQLFPAAEFIDEMPARIESAWPTLPSRQALGLVSRDIIRSPNSAGVDVPQGTSYVGMAGLLLACFAPLYTSRRYVGFLVAMTTLTLAMAYSVPPFPWLIAYTGLSMFKNERLLLMGSFGIAVLAGLGLTVLQQKETLLPSARRKLAFVLLAVGGIMIFLIVYVLRLNTTVRVEFMRRPSFSRALLLVAILLVLLRLLRVLRGRAFPVLICLLAAFDLGTFAYGYTGFGKRPEIFPETSIFRFLKTRGDPATFRVAQVGGPYPANAPMYYGIESADGYEVLTERSRTFAWDYSDNHQSGFGLGGEIFQIEDRRLDMLNLKYLVVHTGVPYFSSFVEKTDRFKQVFSTDSIVIFENLHVLPRAFAVPLSGIEVIPKAEDQMQRVKDPTFDPQARVVLPSMPEFPHGGPQEGTFRQDVQKIANSPNESVYGVSLSQPAIVVVSQTFYPGWTARVDDKAVEIYPANYGLVGIPVPAGSHQVRLAFEPATYKAGRIVTTMSLFILAGLVLSTRKRSFVTKLENS